MSDIRDPAALAHLEKRMTDTFGIGFHEYDGGTALHPVPMAYFTAAIRVTDNSGIMDLLTRWDKEQRKSNAGKKATIPLRALIVLYLLNMQMGIGVSYKQLARTLHYRFTAEHFTALGITPDRKFLRVWYHRVSDTSYRLVALMNPRPSPLRQALTAERFAALLLQMDAPSALKLAERNQNRIDQFSNLLVEASVRCLPRDLWEKYRGNIAIDATKAEIRGRRNSSSTQGARRNPDPLAGRYRREGNHDGQGAKTDVMAYELETAVMTWNKPGENTLFPSLITAISCHNPGRLNGHAAALITRHQKLGFDRIIVSVDRAYNGESIENFHFPAAHAGVDLVFDYKTTDLGIQSHFEDLILVDGAWYVNWMPTRLIDITRKLKDAETELDTAKAIIDIRDHPPKQARKPAELAKQAADELRAEQILAESPPKLAQFAQILASRDPYRMIPKGRPDTDGFQRFTYPPRTKMLALPKNQPKTVSTITIPPTLPENEAVAAGKQSTRKSGPANSSTVSAKSQPIKFTQRFTYKSPEWRAQYGMRNLVESSNSLLKKGAHFHIEDTTKRSGRGYAAVYLALTFAVVASNLHRIFVFLIEEAGRIQPDQKQQRSRRRKDTHGKPLAKSPSRDNPPQG